MSSSFPPGLPLQFPVQPAAAPKSKGPLFWILISLGGLVLVVVCAAGVGSYLIYHAVKTAGLDPVLMKNNPGLATAKLLVAANPDLQAVSTDDSSGTITVRQKSTGETLNLRFDAEKKTLVASDKDGKQVTFSVTGDEQGGAFEVNSDQGTVKFGASSGNRLPPWVPAYPGSAPQGTMSAQTPDGNSSTYTFKTKDGTDQVLDYYAKELANSGLQQTSRGAGAAYGGLLTAEDATKGRTVMITIGNSNDGSDVGVTVIEKKQP